jgi:hypothetical protein
MGGVKKKKKKEGKQKGQDNIGMTKKIDESSKSIVKG